MKHDRILPQWQESLARARQGPVPVPYAVIGQAWSHKITATGDWQSSTLTGSIRVAPGSPAALADFTVSTPTFANSITSWTVSLSASETAAILNSPPPDGVEFLPYDFLMDGQRFFGGVFELSDHITEPA